jgi:hypothetical protein
MVSGGGRSYMLNRERIIDLYALHICPPRAAHTNTARGRFDGHDDSACRLSEFGLQRVIRRDVQVQVS